MWLTVLAVPARHARRAEGADEPARAADVAVLVLGLCGNNYNNGDPSGVCATPSETEGTDRRGLTLPTHQLRLRVERHLADDLAPLAQRTHEGLLHEEFFRHMNWTRKEDIM